MTNIFIPFSVAPNRKIKVLIIMGGKMQNVKSIYRRLWQIFITLIIEEKLWNVYNFYKGTKQVAKWEEWKV